MRAHSQAPGLNSKPLSLCALGQCPGEMSSDSTMAHHVVPSAIPPFRASSHSEARPKHSVRAVRVCIVFCLVERIRAAFLDLLLGNLYLFLFIHQMLIFYSYT